MIRKQNLLMTFASGESLFKDPNFWVFISSLSNIPDTDFVILSDLIPDKVVDFLLLLDIEVVHVDQKDVHYIYRDRHLCFWNYLNKHGYKYKHVLVTDCRDVVFQSNPFDWIPEWKSRYDKIKGNHSFLDHFVIMTAEGHLTSQSGFSCIEKFEFERDVPRPFLKEDNSKHVINGGVFLGTPKALQDWHFLIWMTQMKTLGKCTDQATVNWIMRYLEDDETYSVSYPNHDTLCLTGEGVKEGAVQPVLDGKILCNPQGKPYRILHQWDRLDGLRETVLAQYGNKFIMPIE